MGTRTDESHAILHHEAASKFVGQAPVSAKYSAFRARLLMDFAGAIRFNAGNLDLWAKSMKKLPLALLLMTSLTMAVPASAQTRLTPKAATAARVDNCAPIGRTANGELVYSMKCDNIPAPPPPAATPPQAEAKPAPAAPPLEQETQRTGLFGWSFDRRQDQ